MDLFAQDGEKQVAYPSFKWPPNLQVSLSTMQEVSQIHTELIFKVFSSASSKGTCSHWHQGSETYTINCYNHL